MRPPVRLAQPLEGSSTSLCRNLYICSTCRHGILPRSVLAQQQQQQSAASSRRYASTNTPFTERVRRRIWGTENPPGLKDPYGGEGAIERALKKRGLLKGDEALEISRDTAASRDVEAAAAEDQAAAEAVNEYVPATTWEGLERVGHEGRWSDYPPGEADQYHGFLSSDKVKTSAHVHIAAHQTAVELCLLHDLNKSLTDVCEVVEHDPTVLEMITGCTIKPTAESGNLGDRIVYPDDKTKETLHYVFAQLGQEAPPEEAATESNAQTSGQAQEAEIPQEASAADLVEEPLDTQQPQEEEFIPTPRFTEHAVAPAEQGYLNISLEDINIKFAFLKRFAQVTGYHIPDVHIRGIQSVQHAVELVEKMLQAPKKKKTALQLQENESLKELPNVKIYAKRRTKAHEDEEVGRRKLIGEALRERGLI